MQLLRNPRQPLNVNSSAAAAELIRTAIIEGHLSPGQRLKAEDLARELGVSRTPAREALLILEVEGLVDAPANKGARVRTLSDEEIDDLYRTRALIEGRAAELAAARATPEQIRALVESSERFRKLRPADEVSELIRENQVFHSLVMEASGSSTLSRALKLVSILPLRYRSYWWYSDTQKRLTERHHTQIAKAVERRDPAAAGDAMRDHINSAADFRRSLQDTPAEPLPEPKSSRRRDRVRR